MHCASAQVQCTWTASHRRAVPGRHALFRQSWLTGRDPRSRYSWGRGEVMSSGARLGERLKPPPKPALATVAAAAATSKEATNFIVCCLQVSVLTTAGGWEGILWVIVFYSRRLTARRFRSCVQTQTECSVPYPQRQNPAQQMEQCPAQLWSWHALAGKRGGESIDTESLEVCPAPHRVLVGHPESGRPLQVGNEAPAEDGGASRVVPVGSALDLAGHVEHLAGRGDDVVASLQGAGVAGVAQVGAQVGGVRVDGQAVQASSVLHRAISDLGQREGGGGVE